MQNNQNVLWGIIGLLAGIIIGVTIAGYGVNTGNTQMMRMMGMGKGAQMMQNMMQEMMNGGDIKEMMNGSDNNDQSSGITPEEHLAHHNKD